MRTCPLVLVALLGCKGSAPPPAPAAAGSEADALWAMAPPDATSALVVTSRALQLTDGALAAGRALLAGDDVALMRAMIDVELTNRFGAPVASLADVGIDTSRGLALFESPAGPLWVVQVSDRAKLHRAFELGEDRGRDRLGELTCAPVRERYACARDLAQVRALSTRSSAVPPEIVKLGVRGDIELHELRPNRGTLVAQIDRGAVIIRGAVHAPPRVRALLGAPSPRADASGLTGFLASDVATLSGGLRGRGDAAVQANLDAIAGPLTMTAVAGAPVPEVRMPLKDATRARQWIEACDLPPELRADVQAEGTCGIDAREVGVAIDVWLDGDTLRAGRKTPPPSAAPVRLTALGAELARGRWSFVTWGRGTTLAGAEPSSNTSLLGLLALVSELGIGLRIDGDVVSFVLGLRTVWANPDEVAAALVEVVRKLVRGEADREAAAALANAHPTSPFAIDHQAGRGGMLLAEAGAALLGVALGPVIDELTDAPAPSTAPTYHAWPADRSEVDSAFERLEVALTALATANGRLPAGSVGPTPATSCCDGEQTTCAPAADGWDDPLWSRLSFAITEPHRFRYSYASDGKTFTVIAEGDLDCDGTTVRGKMTGELRGGRVVIDVSPPALEQD